MGNTSIITVFLLVAILGLGVEARASMEINAKLKLLNKPAVKTIQSEDGDVIDCVDIYKQPAFDHPALKNHTLQMAPSFFAASQNSSNDESSNSDDLLRAASLDQFGRKPPARFRNLSNTYPITPAMLALEDRSAAYLVTMGYNYIGAQADINVWNPNVDLPDDYTTAQIWLKNGNGNTFESVEAGWVVNPKLYGDRATRLFLYWTTDSYKSKGCFDVICPGFVQTSTQIALGAAISPVSSPSGQQYHFNVGIFWDPDGGNWWLIVNKNVPVGYWPGKLFGYLSHSAILVEWGGQVYSTQIRKTPHTQTAMGSGDFASGLYGNACYMQNVRIMDYSLSLKYPEYVSTWADEAYCYSAQNYVKYGVEPVFYFGGPGRKPPYCP
ncbi:hypothetical protein L6164_024532 [Bauhinia variegata]|uniref:Uncharacterized protein n=1 Tax=Bauhinia variegata TaxID=167791 RepID=A0ACB9LXI3_BAUVA|nr:hypothetical protein L6164_024532 [Bauhinia variegata]